MTRSRPRVAVLYNAPVLPSDHHDYASEAGVVAAARSILAALKSHGFRPFLMSARPPAQRLVRSLERKHPDLVFNLIEGFGGHSGGEAHVTSLLEMMGIPYTGCPPEAQSLARHKGRTKALLLGSGLPTARFWVVAAGDSMPIDPWPGNVIVKPESEDASLGIDQDSIVTTHLDLSIRVRQVREKHGPNVLIESYLPGPEYNVGVLALPTPKALPVAEILYTTPPGRWPILTYEAKWHVGSAEDLASRPRCPAEISPEMEVRLRGLAESAFRACGCRDYARVDFRLDEHGEPMILEVNPNPDLDPSAGLARAIAAGGLDWSETISALARQALQRGAVHD
ncbi:MAG: ATP-grasp enzyme D-alanine-D-alanine ligase [Planctomycetota bacterium]|nr:ATP-grasp enzyme D-alanine-D-alanine ligase [Planctomycetota bacterium]